MNKKSMMDLFIEKELDCHPIYLTEITKERYQKEMEENGYKKCKIYELSFYKELLKDLRFPPHPLKEIILLEDSVCNYGNGSVNWAFVFQFKHKGKYYFYADVDGI